MSGLRARVARVEQKLGHSCAGDFAHLSDEELWRAIAAHGGSVAAEHPESWPEADRVFPGWRRDVELAIAFTRGEITVAECWERRA